PPAALEVVGGGATPRVALLRYAAGGSWVIALTAVDAWGAATVATVSAGLGTVARFTNTTGPSGVLPVATPAFVLDASATVSS
ncbi:hypothetical protein, partial [Bacillus altitudinis]|uniref:hypothetical protein n=1 Tax=Bacillus altitudinis TaxID=293387 RepID=UPI002F94D57A